MSGSGKGRWQKKLAEEWDDPYDPGGPLNYQMQAAQTDAMERIADTLDRMLAVMLDEGDDGVVDPFASLDLPVIPTADSDTDHPTL